jgi:hypothetical protein
VRKTSRSLCLWAVATWRPCWSCASGAGRNPQQVDESGREGLGVAVLDAVLLPMLALILPTSMFKVWCHTDA